MIAAVIGRRMSGSDAKLIKLLEKSANPALLNAVTEWKTPSQAASPNAVVVADPPSEREQHGDDGLDAERQDGYAADDPAHLTDRYVAALGGRVHPSAKSQASKDDDGDDRGAGGDTQATQLDEGQDDDLAEPRPVGRGVDGAEAGDGDRRHRGEEGRHQVSAARSLARDGEQQQERAQHDERQEGGSNVRRRTDDAVGPDPSRRALRAARHLTSCRR